MSEKILMTLTMYTDITSGRSNVQSKNLDLHFITNGVNEYEDTFLK